MKVRTVGLLSAVAMTLTSLSVWSVTPPGGWSERVLEEARIGMAVTPAGDASEPWKFDDGATLKVEGRLGHHTLAATRDNDTYLFVDVRAPSDQQASQQAPVNLAIVIDRSGSMLGKKMQNALDGARGMVRRMRDGDVVSVISYNTRSELVVAPTTIDASSRERVIDAIATITAAGDTCISCGLDTAMSTLQQRRDMVDRILLLSDGEPTAGVRDVDGFRRIADRARDMGCAITSVGVDVEYNERIMSAIALESNGRHYFVENADALAAVFDQEEASLRKLVARDATVRVALGPGVEVEQVFDRSFRREGDELVVPMGTFTAGEQKTLLVKVRVPRGGSAETLRVADVKLAFEDLVSGRRSEHGGQLQARLTRDASQVPELDPLVAGRLGRTETAAALREANDLFARGDVARAQAKLAGVRSTIEGRRAASAAQPFERNKEVENELSRQVATLDKADDAFEQGGFAEPPPPAGGFGSNGPSAPAAAPPAQRAGKAQVRANAEAATDLAF